jgi:transposase
MVNESCNGLLPQDLRHIWEQLGKFPSQTKLLDWYHQAMASGIHVLDDFARILLVHAHGILAWYDCPITTSPLEGTTTRSKP